MDQQSLKKLLRQVKNGRLDISDALERLKYLPEDDLGFARIDSHRALRKGFPEVVFGAGKTTEQIVQIFQSMNSHGSDILITRCSTEAADMILNQVPKAEYFKQSGALLYQRRKKRPKGGLLLVISAGTSDIPIAEEAVVTARAMGSKVKELYDVGVAGIHRILRQKELLGKAKVVVVAAGMEGALPSVVGGLTPAPVVAVPTSVGYGASFNGLAALLGMLNSCSPGVVVVNIDNGFGAGYTASLIAQS